MYAVKEIFYTLQGEGAQAGRPSVFLRFSGCNLWNGVEKDRATAVCTFCDTDFVGINGTRGGKYTAQELSSIVHSLWPTSDNDGKPYVVCTGGEPLLQLDTALIDALHEKGFEIAVETNGTQKAPQGIDWICVSPKAGAALIQLTGDELKLVFPQENLLPHNLSQISFKNYFLQPMDGPEQTENTKAALQYCLANPKWKLSLQTHKILGIE